MLPAGTTFHRYRIESLLGAGGMGEVYRAYDPALKRYVALKVLREEKRDADGIPWTDAVARAKREAQAAAALQHPNAVTVYDVGEVDGAPFIAMELVEGQSLAKTLAGGDVPMHDRLRWLVQVARALDAAHRVGLVHRDIKPDNIIVCKDGSAKVLDFGIAKRAPSMADTRDAGPPSFRTATGLIIGTPRYMAPEQLSGQRVDPKSDQFAWALVAYECIGGPSAVHASRDPYALVHAREPPKLLSEIVPGLPIEVAVTIARAMATNPEQRFASLAEAADALEPFASERALVGVAHTSVAAPRPAAAPTGEGTVSAIRHEVAPPSAPPQPEPTPPPKPTPPTPRRPLLVVSVVLLSLFAGGVAVLAALRFRTPTNVAAPIDASSASAPATTALAQTGTATETSASPSTSQQATSSVSRPIHEHCQCLALRTERRLCTVEASNAPRRCECAADRGQLLCPKPVTPGPHATCGDEWKMIGTKNGDACTGFLVYMNEGAPNADAPHAGTLRRCACQHADTYRGVTGASCTGRDAVNPDDARTFDGKLSCE